jgi:hypothetical protein
MSRTQRHLGVYVGRVDLSVAQYDLVIKFTTAQAYDDTRLRLILLLSRCTRLAHDTY